ncbi:hypothetical protein ACFVH9_23530 [Streptomyces hirsutus]|uniref:hypothetical protein n=1 Tax=Streptomyces hirsutus TaxID=35620 RepID=UPI0036390ED1
MPATTEKTKTLYGCRLGPTALRQLARIASEGIEEARVSFSHTHDSTNFSAGSLDELLELVENSSVVTNMSNCTNLTVAVHATGYFVFFGLSPEGASVTFRGPDREVILGKFETAMGYLRGHGGVDATPSVALRPFLYIIGIGVILQFGIYVLGRGKLVYSVTGTAVCFMCYGIAWRVKKKITNRRANVINAVGEPQVLSSGWNGLSVTDRIASIVTILTAIAAAGTVASALADWVK